MSSTRKELRTKYPVRYRLDSSMNPAATRAMATTNPIPMARNRSITIVLRAPEIVIELFEPSFGKDGTIRRFPGILAVAVFIVKQVLIIAAPSLASKYISCNRLTNLAIPGDPFDDLNHKRQLILFRGRR
jgi:hypothetical protein